MPSLCFVQPAYRRYELSRICLEQRRQACDDLRRWGIEADTLVIADDENLTIARDFDFLTLVRSNEWLGRKWNDGYQHAAELGFDHVMPMGSDMFFDPEAFRLLPEGDEWIMHRKCSIVSPKGTKRIDAHLTPNVVEMGVNRLMPVRSIAHVGYRPMTDQINRGCDGSTWRVAGHKVTMCDRCGHEHECLGAKIVEHECRDLEMVNFQSRDTQVTNFRLLASKYGRGHEARDRDHWPELAARYGWKLINKVKTFYERGAGGGPSYEAPTSGITGRPAYKGV